MNARTYQARSPYRHSAGIGAMINLEADDVLTESYYGREVLLEEITVVLVNGGRQPSVSP